MTRSEIALLLAAIAGRDQRTVGDADVLAWHEDLNDLDLDDAMQAIRRHFRESTERVMPAHIRRLVKVIRTERREHHEALALPGKLEDDPVRAVRMQRGMATVNQVLARINERLARGRTPADVTETPQEAIRRRALERAMQERRGRRDGETA